LNERESKKYKEAINKICPVGELTQETEVSIDLTERDQQQNPSKVHE
jgi:hypothetical protein